MRLWIGGIVDSIIADDFRRIRNSLEERVNSFIMSVNYGVGMSTWDVILVVSDNPPKEYIRFNKRSKQTDIRKVLDFDLFVNQNAHGKMELMQKALLASIDDLLSKNINDFNLSKLKEDFVVALDGFSIY